MINIRKKLQILALVAGISLGGVAQVKADLNWKHYLGAMAGGATLLTWDIYRSIKKSRIKDLKNKYYNLRNFLLLSTREYIYLANIEIGLKNEILILEKSESLQKSKSPKLRGLIFRHNRLKTEIMKIIDSLRKIEIEMKNVLGLLKDLENTSSKEIDSRVTDIDVS